MADRSLDDGDFDYDGRRDDDEDVSFSTDKEKLSPTPAAPDNISRVCSSKMMQITTSGENHKWCRTSPMMRSVAAPELEADASAINMKTLKFICIHCVQEIPLSDTDSFGHPDSPPKGKEVMLITLTVSLSGCASWRERS